MVAEFDPGQQQVGTHGNPDLRQYRIPGGADKGLDLEVLFDAFEEQLDLPACLVDVGDGLGRQMEIVGQKDVVLSGPGIAVADTTQRDRAGIGLGAGDENALVTGQPFGFDGIAALNNTVSGVALLPGDKENIFVIQGIKPSVVDIGTIHDDDAVRR